MFLPLTAADLMTHEDQRQGQLIQILVEQTITDWQEISAVFLEKQSWLHVSVSSLVLLQRS